MRHSLTLVGWLAAAAVVMGLLARELSRAWFLTGPQPEVIDALQQSLSDQRELARLDPQTAPERRQRFERTQALARRLRVLALSREEMARRHTALLLGAAIVVAVAAGGLHVWRQSRRDRRLARLQAAFRELAHGAPDVQVGITGRDVLGRIARMVEEVSAHHTRDRRRLASLEDLARWQEAARRHAHEMRTPLSAAQLDLGRLRDGVEALPEAGRETLTSALDNLDGDLRRLAEFARAFGDFGRLPPPRPAERDLAAFLREFAERFARAWPELDFAVDAPETPSVAAVDPELLRQVLVNLCENSARSVRDVGRARGRLHLKLAAAAGGWTVDVTDDGPGIPAPARSRLFQPYVTTRPGGTGLGLAVSRKILLDHGGDLECMATDAGATFRLTFPATAVTSAA